MTFWNDPLSKKTVIIAHFIDLATRLSAASVITSKDPKSIIDALVKSWLNVFGAPAKVFTDNGGEFANEKLIELMEQLGIQFKATAAEASFSNGINERHHAIIKSILDKIRSDHVSTPVDIILSYAVFAKNCLIDNLGYSAHQRSPNIPTIMSNNPCVTDNKIESELVNNHINMLHKTRQAYISAESSDRIKRALNSKIFVSESPFYYGERVYYWKESINKTSNGWKGPGTIIGTEGKVVIIRQESFIHRAHETRVRRCIVNEALEKKGNDVVKELPLVIDEFVDDSNIEHIDNKTSNDENNKDSKLLDESRSTDNTENNESQSSNESKGNIITLRSRDRIKPAKRWGFDEAYKVDDDENVAEAKSNELESWRIHEVYKEVNIEKATTPLISTRWILTTKERLDKSNYMKARLVIRGFEDIDKDSVLSESPTAHVESVKVMLAILPTIGFKPKKMDISTAFLQGKSLTRPVFIKPPKEANVSDEKCWMLLKGVYGLTDASRMWYERVNEVLTNGEYVRSLVDPALYFKYRNDEVAGIVLCHVDDFLYAGTDNELKNIEKLIGDHFKVRTIEEKEFMFCGFYIQVMETGKGRFSITYSQPDKISEIYPIETDMKDPSAIATEKQVTQFRSVLGALQWHSCNTRPDIAFSISSLLANSKNLLVKHCILANKTLRKAKASDPVKIQCVDLSSDANNCNSFKLNVYSDASFANLPDLGSQRGSMAFIENLDGKRNLIDFTSRRIKRVCRSTFAAELLGCNAAVDLAIYYREIIRNFKIKLLTTIISDSRSVKENLTSIVSRCEEKRLKIELAYLREVMSEKDIKIRWVCSSEQLADVLTKEKPGIDILNVITNSS